MLVAWDYETHLISPEHPYPKPICVSSFNGWNKKLAVSNEIESHVSYILDHTNIAHNATFELGVTWRWFPSLRPKIKKALAEGRVHCTQIMHGILNSRIEHPLKSLSLASLVLKYFEEDLSEDKKNPDAWRLRYSELEGIPKEQWPEEAVDYAIMDSVYAFKLYKELSQHQLAASNAIETSFYLNLMGKTGITIDQSRVLQLENEIYARLEPTYKSLIDNGFCTATGSRRPKKNMKVLAEYISKTVKNPIKSPKGNIKTDLEALNAYYLDTQDRVFLQFLELNEYDKVLTAFVSRLKSAEKIYTDYRLPMSTFRTSSASSKLYPSVNIQQMPRKVPNVTWDVRNCFVPREGYKMVSIDYSGLELASAATQLYKIFGCSEMLNMLNAGDKPVDLHSMLAAKIMTLKGQTTSYEHFLAHKKEEPYSGMRQLCKAINLGFPGGIGYDVMRHQLLTGGIKTKYGIITTSKNENTIINICRGLKFSEPNVRIKQVAHDEWALVYDELVGLKKDMFKVYPDLERFLKEYHTRAIVYTKKEIDGELRTVPVTKWQKNDFGDWEEEPMYQYKVRDFYRDWCTYTAYCNGFLMQTPSAIGATNTAIQLGRIYAEHPDVNLLAFIHDEFLFEVKEDKLHHIKDIADVMITEMQKTLKGVRISVEATTMSYWTKDGGTNQVYWKDTDKTTLRRAA